MGIDTILLAVVSSYLLIGLVLAFMNDYMAKNRKYFIEKVVGLRLEAFKKGISMNIEIDESLRGVGIDAEYVINGVLKENNSKEIQFVPMKMITCVIFVVFILCGPLYFSLTLEGYNRVRLLRKAYYQARERVDKF